MFLFLIISSTERSVSRSASDLWRLLTSLESRGHRDQAGMFTQQCMYSCFCFCPYRVSSWLVEGSLVTVWRVVFFYDSVEGSFLYEVDSYTYLGSNSDNKEGILRNVGSLKKVKKKGMEH